jgi:hypothetical protein
MAWFRTAGSPGDASFAVFRKTFAAAQGLADLPGDIIKARVTGLPGEMRIEADIAKGGRGVPEGCEHKAMGFKSINANFRYIFRQ